MSLVIPIFLGGGEGSGVSLNMRGRGGGGLVNKKESPDFRSPEVGISADLCCHNSTAGGAHSKQTHI